MKNMLWLVAALVVVFPVFSFAADLRSAEVISKETKTKNLYLAGENPTVDANVLGDLAVAGGTVTVNGDVEDSILAAGGTLNVFGATGGNLRVAGGTVTLDGTVGGDVVVFGGEVTLGTKSVVAGDVIVFGGTVNMRGTISGSVKSSSGGTVTISGKTAGDVELYNAGEVKLDAAAVIEGKLKYSAEQEATIASGAKVGKTEFTKVSTMNSAGQTVADRAGGIVISILMGLISLLVFIKLLPKFSAQVLEAAMVKPLRNFWVGFVAIVVTPFALLLLLITFVGWGVLWYVFLAYLAFFAFTGTLSALLVGSFAWKYLRKEEMLTVNWKTASLGVVLYVLVSVIPFVGGVFGLVVGWTVFGALTQMGFGYLKAQQA